MRVQGLDYVTVRKADGLSEGKRYLTMAKKAAFVIEIDVFPVEHNGRSLTN